MMFKPVENPIETALFNDIWTTVWKEKGYEIEFSKDALARYVVLTPDGNYIGTAEINLFNKSRSAVSNLTKLQKYILDAAEEGMVAEIDKIALIKPFRGSYISDLLSSIIYFAELHHYRYFLSLLEPVFYRALRVSFHIPMEKLSQETYYKGDYVVPVLFDTQQMYANWPMFHWLKLPS
ncbi:hypothetical protein [Paenibacillus prosopidis]|uniref:N-acetyltransferase domain-containing protein n=1 Tax=Paenibacillus prosopidis TaxID=630520 RepID=A0A368VNX2_9BACL|nr:hypothetical protein [Paenibacillus prosopidis]RCW42572.1 hypothetical protein DFP97_1152 [Paenibacillus prosopidis]